MNLEKCDFFEISPFSPGSGARPSGRMCHYRGESGRTDPGLPIELSRRSVATLVPEIIGQNARYPGSADFKIHYFILILYIKMMLKSS